MKTLQQHYQAIKELLKNPPLDSDGYQMYEVFEIMDYYEKHNSFDGLEVWELDMLKKHIHYLCIMDDGWY